MKEKQSNQLVGITKFTEPIIVSGKYFGIKPLSAYDFMLCTKMIEKLMENLISQGFEEKISKNISEKACVVAMCLHGSDSKKVFNDGLEALKGLAPYELKNIYDEYVKLTKKFLKRDETLSNILLKVKKSM